MVRVPPPSAKDLGSVRSLFRSSKLCLLTARTVYFTTNQPRLPVQDRDGFQVKGMWKHVDHVQLDYVIAGFGE